MITSVDFYNKNAEEYYYNTVNIDMSIIYHKFLNYLPPGGKILDAGCGSGRDSLFFLKKGFQVLAFDASAKMVEMSSQLISQDVLLATFENFQTADKYDGIWACASLLHVEKSNIDMVIDRLTEYLKFQGTFYMSFKYGQQDYQKEGRHFTCFQEDDFSSFFSGHPMLIIVDLFKTADVRPDRPDEYWLNCFLKKSQP